MVGGSIDQDILKLLWLNTMIKTARHCGPCNKPDERRSHPQTLLFKMNFNIILSFKYRFPKLPLAFCFSSSTYTHVSHAFHVWGILITLISAILIRSAKDYKLSRLIMTFLCSPVMSSHIQTFLSAPWSPTPSVYALPSCRNNQVSHPHKTGNTAALWITQYCCCCSETWKLCHTFVCYLYVTFLSCILLTEILHLPSFFPWSFLVHCLPKSTGTTLKI